MYKYLYTALVGGIGLLVNGRGSKLECVCWSQGGSSCVRLMVRSAVAPKPMEGLVAP